MKSLPKQQAALIEQAIRSAQAAGDLPAFDIPAIKVEAPQKAEHGDYATPIALGLAKIARAKPLDIANTIVQYIPAADFVGKVTVAPPGYINFQLSDGWLRAQVEAIIAAGDEFGTVDIGQGKRAQVEFVSANPTGPLHIGRSRGAVVGDSIARILAAAGYTVEREYYFNNAGMQMQHLGESLYLRYLAALGQPVMIPDEVDKTFYRGTYLIDFAKALAAEEGTALVGSDWQPFKEYAEERMFAAIRATLARIDVIHNYFFNETTLYDNGAIQRVLERLTEQGYVYESATRESAAPTADSVERAPAKWFRSTQLGDTEDRVLLKADGSPTYTLPDIAYHIDKIERGFDLLVNILGADHLVEAQVVRHGLRALNYRVDHLHVIIIQMVRMIREGKEVRMSTRRGDYDTLDDLIDQTSADAVRYMLLARNPNSHLDFDLDLAVKQSNENPVYYIQYAHVRCAGIFREAKTRGVTAEGADLSLLGDEELLFIRKALELIQRVETGAENLEPHGIAYYALELANLFHPLYDRVRVFGSDVAPELAQSRLRFYQAAQIVFRRVLQLLGMSTPERM